MDEDLIQSRRLEEEIAELEKASSGIIEQTKEVQYQEPEPKEEVSQEEETFKKRYGDLRRHSQKQIQDLKNEIDKLKEGLQNQNNAGLPSNEDLKTWIKENPKAAAIIRGIKAEDDVPVKELSSVKKEVEKIKQEAKIRKVHPDFDDIVGEDDFHNWANEQPSNVQNLIFHTMDADSIIWAINLYKTTKTSSKTNPSKEVAKAVTKTKSSEAPAGTKQGFSESQIRAMSDEDFEKNEPAIQASMRDGSFVYDLSGAAR